MHQPPYARDLGLMLCHTCGQTCPQDVHYCPRCGRWCMRANPTA